MDEDVAELITAMCTRAGMIMKDASLLAITIPKDNPQAAKRTIVRLVDDAETIRHLLAAAALLHAAEA